MKTLFFIKVRGEIWEEKYVKTYEKIGMIKSNVTRIIEYLNLS